MLSYLRVHILKGAQVFENEGLAFELLLLGVVAHLRKPWNIIGTTVDGFWRLRWISHAEGTILIEIPWFGVNKQHNLYKAPRARRHHMSTMDVVFRPRVERRGGATGRVPGVS